MTVSSTLETGVSVQKAKSLCNKRFVQGASSVKNV